MYDELIDAKIQEYETNRQACVQQAIEMNNRAMRLEGAIQALTILKDELADHVPALVLDQTDEILSATN